VLTFALAVGWWSMRALPLAERGKHLVTAGPYRYVRHPLYSTFFLFGLAALVIAQTYLVLVALILLYLIAQVVIRYEEGLMERQFGQEWREYAKKTPRFFPRLWRGDGVMDPSSNYENHPRPEQP